MSKLNSKLEHPDVWLNWSVERHWLWEGFGIGINSVMEDWILMGFYKKYHYHRRWIICRVELWHMNKSELWNCECKKSSTLLKTETYISPKSAYELFFFYVSYLISITNSASFTKPIPVDLY